MRIGHGAALHVDRRQPTSNRDGVVGNGHKRVAGRTSRHGHSTGGHIGKNACADGSLTDRCGIAGEHRHPCAFTRGVGDDLVSLEEKRKFRDTQHHEQQQREDERKLDELCTVFAEARPQHPSQCRHNVTTVPIVIGTAYASLGPFALSSVTAGRGRRPMTRQCINTIQRFEIATLR